MSAWKYYSLNALLLGMAGVVGCTMKEADPASDAPIGEMVCETDGVLTERHVMVSRLWIPKSGYIVVRYTDGNEAYYTPMPGESCMFQPN